MVIGDISVRIVNIPAKVGQVIGYPADADQGFGLFNVKVGKKCSSPTIRLVYVWYTSGMRRVYVVYKACLTQAHHPLH